MKFKRLICLFFLICCLLTLTANAENLVNNPEFSADESGMHVDGWYCDCYVEENSLLFLDSDEQALYINSYDPNDARWQ